MFEFSQLDCKMEVFSQLLLISGGNKFNLGNAGFLFLALVFLLENTNPFNPFWYFP